jgi:Kef-type K+ transport system membrane component KefB
MEIIVKLSIVLVVGFIGGKLAKAVKLPSVSGYLVVGLFLGPSFFNLVTPTDSASLSIVNELALAFIAFSIGSEFVVKAMMKMGKAIAFITLTEVVGAVALVFSIMFFVFKQPFAFSIVIASMSAATAPAATLMVMKQYRANGPMTRTILPIVALDDVYGIMAFGIAMSLAKLSISTENIPLWEMFTAPFLEIGGSFLLGAVLGLLLAFITKKFTSNRDETMVITLTAVALATGLSKVLGFSPILTNIAMGTMVVNVVRNSQRIFSTVNDFSPIFYVLFFTLAGASLDLAILSSVGVMGLAYIICRAAGKMIGSWFGCKVMKSPKLVTKWMGLGLLPQGGISIGLSVLVRQELPEYAVAITTIIMFSVLVYEISGPIFAKIAITKAGEVNGMDRFEETEPVRETPVSSPVEPVDETLAQLQVQPVGETPVPTATQAPTELVPQPE